MLEFDLLHSRVCEFAEPKSDGDVMGALLIVSNVRYAVIQTSANEKSPNEWLLRMKMIIACAVS
jgi:hypothetical protein